MIKLTFPKPDFKIRELGGQPEIFDGIRQKWVALQPEEWVRQNFISWLTKAAGIPTHSIAVEKGLRLGNLMKRFDLLVFDSNTQPWMMVECKAADVPLKASVLMQILSYNLVIPVRYLVITNGVECHVADKKKEIPEWLSFFPKHE
ncbi:MAG: type I restriction enzyme HsdR N-terminal domain-containing protein [Chitinophagaceae bacterium]|nr:type I restriction enzyme HsdR N-terminal domain-containing protein [Chitinophagaceae bacterium]